MIAQRFETQEVAQIEVYGRSHSKIVARLKNISTTGAFFELAQSEYVPKQGDIVCVTVHLDSLNRSRIVNAEVVWNRGLGFGAQFLLKDELVSRLLSVKS
jgi:PilZ domain